MIVSVIIVVIIAGILGFSMWRCNMLTRREEAEAKRRAEDLAYKKVLLEALAPFLDALHKTYGKYAPDLIPASWYEPRRHYIEYMAGVIYTIHARQNNHTFISSGITADSHPLAVLRSLYFPYRTLQEADLTSPQHPVNVLIHAITDPTHPDHIIFHDLIPQGVDLLTYLKSDKWHQPYRDVARDFDVLVNQSITANQYTIIGFPTDRREYLNPVPIFYREERFRHTYIIGKTGSGKSTLLRNLITQDIHHNHGLIVLSPENDLFEKLMSFIPEERKDDLIYFDPTDTKPPIIGFNPLTLETGEDLTQKAGETMTVLTRALGDLGVTMEPLIRNAIYALLQCPQSTFADFRRLIDPFDSELRRTVKNDANIDETTRMFWTRYEQSSYYQKSHEAVLNRLDPFFRPPLATILASPALSFKTELNEAERIIFLNLSRLRGTEAATIGQLLLAEIQQALLLRDQLPDQARIPYYLYIDEFQTYAAHSEHSLINLFNGARKYKLAVTIAHQTTADIPAKLLSTIVGNVGTVITLQLAAEDAPYFARELQIRKDDKDSYRPEALQNLTVGYGYARTPSSNTGIHITIPATPVVPLPEPIPADQLKATSKKNYGLKPEQETILFPAPHEQEAEPTPEPTAAADVEAPDAHVETPAPEPAPTPRPAPARQPVVRRTIAKKPLIPEETIEIE